ncbi:MAG: M50 family metallopeptidase [Solirubrobacterales bacterium]
MSWVLAFAGFAALIILHEAGHFAVAKAVGMRVERFFLFFPPKLASFKRGETEYGIGAVPLGGFVKISGMNPDEDLPDEVRTRAYYGQPVWKRVVVIAAGPVVNLLIAFVLLFFLAFGIEEPTTSVSEIETGSPAAAKLEPGDMIVSVDGVSGDQEQIARQLDTHDCAGERMDGCRADAPAEVRVIRDGEPLTLPIRPQFDGELERMRLGFAYGTAPLDPSGSEAATRSVDFMWLVTSETVKVIARIFDPEQREQISGVVGSYEFTRQAIDFDSRRALTLLAVISLSLAVINLFPFLPLDGGHIFWAIVEKVRGKPVPFSVMERAGVLGFMLVLVLFVIGLSNDIDRLTGEGFDVR